METTRLSSKGQVVLPRAIRTATAWQPGQALAVEITADGVLLRPLRPFAATTLAEVVGCTGYEGPRKSLRQMEAAIKAEARRRK